MKPKDESTDPNPNQALMDSLLNKNAKEIGGLLHKSLYHANLSDKEKVMLHIEIVCWLAAASYSLSTTTKEHFAEVFKNNLIDAITKLEKKHAEKEVRKKI